MKIFNQILVLLLIIGVVVGILATAQFIGSEPTLDVADVPKEEAHGNIVEEIEKMEKRPWEKTSFYRIKDLMSDYKKYGKIDDKQHEELSELLTNKYLVLLDEAVRKFCASSVDMALWNELKKESTAFKTKDLANVNALLDSYKTLRAVAIEATQYGQNEQYNDARSISYEQILNGFSSKPHIKDNPTVAAEVEGGLQALGTVRGLDRRFNTTDLKTCDCNDKFGRNKFYKEACEQAQKK